MKWLAGFLVGVVALGGVALWWSDAAADDVAADRDLAADLTLARPVDGPTPTVAAFRPKPAAAPLHDPVVVSPCALLPCQEQEVSSQVDGVLQDVAAELGQEVAAGQLLARLDADQSRAQVELLRIRATSESAERVAKAQFDEADSKVRYAEKANGSAAHSVPELEYKTYVFQRERYAQEIRRAREDREAAGKELERARKVLEQHDVRGGMAGVIVKVYKRPGEAVKQAEPLFRVANYRRLRIEGLCKASQGGLLRVGMPARVEPELRVEPMTELAGHTGAVTGLAVGPDGALLASASEDRTVAVWDWRRGRRVVTLPHPTGVDAVAFGPGTDRDSVVLVAGAADGRVWFWPLRPDAPPPAATSAAVHRGAVRALAVSPDGRFVASGGDDRRIGTWALADGRHLGWIEPADGQAAHQGAVTSLSFTPDGRLVSAGRDNAIRIWEWQDGRGRLVGVRHGRTGEVGQLGVSPDGRRLLFDHGDEMRLLDRDTGGVVGSLHPRRQGRFQSLALFSPGGGLILTGATNGRLQLWQAPVSPTEAEVLRQGYRVGFGPASLFPPAPVRGPALWDLGGGELRQLVVPGGGAGCAAFAPDESAFFTGGADRVVRVWPVPPPGSARRPLEARLTFVADQMERGTETVRIRAEMDNPPDMPLRAGGYVHLKFYPETAGHTK